jgi:hypothetical protein
MDKTPDIQSMQPGNAPTRRALLRSTAIALLVALALLVTVVLPAEYGVDPTGVGKLLGLKEMGEIKVQLAREAEAADSAVAAANANADAPAPALPQVAAPTGAAQAAKSEITEITLAPAEGKEIKLAMRKGAVVAYSWKTDRGVVNYDTHADAPGIDYHGYDKGKSVASKDGTLTAAFDGMHGWFWRNRTSEPITVTLSTRGDYAELKRPD